MLEIYYCYYYYPDEDIGDNFSCYLICVCCDSSGPSSSPEANPIVQRLIQRHAFQCGKKQRKKIILEYSDLGEDSSLSIS